MNRSVGAGKAPRLTFPPSAFNEKHQSPPIDASPEAIIQAGARSGYGRRFPLYPALADAASITRQVTPTLTSAPDKLPRHPLASTLLPCYSKIAMKFLLGWLADSGARNWACASWKVPHEFHHFTDPRPPSWCCALWSCQTTLGMPGCERKLFVCCPTPRVKALFACYWALIRPASGWIRRRTLLSVQRKLSAISN
ncbi:Uncharacterised protein [Serratia fonticola]|uniref:Uncharacterized protein n=1 Tax=Serratia fonticola TaxID=47917 RepID=A0A4U9U118_SERFO|nr:Uncharacterised protein [Serratia fonticola]